MPEKETKTEETTEKEITETEEESTEESTEEVIELSEKEKKAISESRKYQNRAQKAEKALEKIRGEKLSEDEKKDLKLIEEKNRADEAETKLKDSNLNSMILEYASTLGFKDLDVVKLIARKELEGDEDISQADVKLVIDSIAKDKKYLLGSDETTVVGKGNFEGGKKIEEEETINDRFKKALQQGRNRNII